MTPLFYYLWPSFFIFAISRCIFICSQSEIMYKKNIHYVMYHHPELICIQLSRDSQYEQLLKSQLTS
jgi:hypothetical protein